MSVQTVFRVLCEGPCGGWLRKGRVTPSHWGDGYAELFPSPEAAQQAADEAGWRDGRCPQDQASPSPGGNQ